MSDDFDTSVSQEDLNPVLEDEVPLKEESASPFGQPTPKRAGPRQRSALDAVLDAVHGKSPIVVDRRSCPKCGSTNTQRRGGLMGGTLVLKCRAVGCRAEFPIGSYKPQYLPADGAAGSSNPVMPGPFDSEPRVAPTPFTPMFKRKS